MIRKLFLSLLLSFQLVLCVPAVNAALEMPDKNRFDALIKDNKVTQVGEKRQLRDYVTGIFSEDNLRIANGVFAGIGFIYLIILGIKMLFTRGNDEKLTNYRMEFFWIILGLIVISGSYFFGDQILNPRLSTLETTDGTLSSFDTFGRGLIDYLRILVASIALGVLLLSGYQLITSPEEETVNNEKSFIRSFLLGIGFILLSEIAVTVLSGDNFEGAPNEELAKRGIDEVIGIVNYLLAFVAGCCFIMMVLAAFYFVISFGDEDRTGRAKKIIIGNLAAGVVAFSLLVIIRVFVNG